MNDLQVLNNAFNITTHKKTFINYLEVIIDESGTIMYATPSHQEKLIAIACEKLCVTRQELFELCPKEYYFDLMNWLCKLTECIALWNHHKVGIPNDKQVLAIEELTREGLYKEKGTYRHTR